MSVQAQLAEDFSKIVEGLVETYVEAKNFGFIHELWNHPLIMVFESSIIDNMNIKLAV